MDDNMAFNLDMAAMLNTNGFETEVACSGEKCLSRIESGYRPDLVLMDIDLGPNRIDGIETARLLEKYDIPVVFSSGHTDAETLGKLRKAPGFGCIQKSFESDYFIVENLHRAYKEIQVRRDMKNRDRENRSYQALYEEAPFMFLEVGGDRIIKRANRIVGVFLGHEYEDLPGFSLGDAFHCSNRAVDPRGCGFSPRCLRCGFNSLVRRSLSEEAGCLKGYATLRISKNGNGRGKLQHFSVTGARVLLNGEYSVLLAVENRPLESPGRLCRPDGGDHRIFAEHILSVLEFPICIIKMKSKDLLYSNSAFAEFWKKEETEADYLGAWWDTTLDERARNGLSTLLGKASAAEDNLFFDQVLLRDDPVPVQAYILPECIEEEPLAALVFHSGTETPAEVENLRRENNMLGEALKEKDFLLREVHHRVKNNLVMIRAFINFTVRNIEARSVSIREVLRGLQNQVTAIGTIHEKLSHSPDARSVDLKSYVQDLLSAVLHSFSEVVVTLELDIPRVFVSADTATSLGIMFNEMATNAIKHGFTGEGSHVFSIRLIREKESRECRIEIMNSGKPFPDGMELHNQTSLGLRLIASMVDQLDGTITPVKKKPPVYSIALPSHLFFDETRLYDISRTED